MKNSVTILLICLFFFTSCSVTNTKFSSKTDYKVKKIESDHSLYIIEVKRNDSTFKVISLKENFEENLEAIKVGSKYPLNLLQLYPNEFIVGKYNEAISNPKDSVVAARLTTSVSSPSLYIRAYAAGARHKNTAAKEATKITPPSIRTQNLFVFNFPTFQ